MTRSHEFRQRRDGSIDFDFYRTQAAIMRAQAMQDAIKLKSAFNALSALAATVMVVSAPALVLIGALVSSIGITGEH